MKWLIENWDVLVSGVGGLLALATAVTRLTPSPKDDAVVREIVSIFSLLEHADVRGPKPPTRKAKRGGE